MENEKLNRGGFYQPNNIYNEDCYKAIKEIPDKSIDLVIIDPPYEMDEHGGGGAFGNKNRPYQNLVDTLAYGITDEILQEIERIQKKTNVYVFCNKNQLRQLFNFYKDKNVDLLVWNKTNPIPRCNNKYLSDIEYIFFARDERVEVYGNYETLSKFYQSSVNKEDKNLYNHPTIKPEELICKLIINSSKESDLVFDCFLGSGTTCVCAKKLNRKYLGFEIDDNYFRIAQDRLNGITQQERKQKENGITNIFDFIDE